MPVVAIVGKPNVGKSTLFNLLVKQDRSLVGPERGITRDRIYGRWSLGADAEVDLVDTGGFDTIGETPFADLMREQTLIAIRDADLILCLFDARTPVNPDDSALVALLRKSQVPVVFVANKVDDPGGSTFASMIYELGIDGFIEISAKNRRGTGELIHRVKELLGKQVSPCLEDSTEKIRVGILGRPNVGKSLLINRIIGENRTLVSPEAGTTRDAVDIAISRGEREYIFVDTAGIRRKSRIDTSIERLSVIRSLKNVYKSHVCLLLLDPKEGLTDQDKRLCGIFLEHGRAFALVVNKSDLIEAGERKLIKEQLIHSLKFMPDAPLTFVSALTGSNVSQLYPMIEKLFLKTTHKIPTPQLNRHLARIVDAHSPPLIRGRALRFFYITQVGTVPPRFRVVSNFPKQVPGSYERYFMSSLKKATGLEGIPIKLVFSGK
ncbi:MAG TPA: ribosome biogenesis GTPase Der [Deltaproteobacteria bacterium]|nr:ribosome biogenesis GTPase Der [Deltaproteobacteria bacterium]